MTFAVAALVDLTVIITLALVATFVLRKRSASLRHAVLGAAIVASAVVPALELLVPAWDWPIAWGAAPESSSTLTLASPTITDDNGAWTAAPPTDSFAWVNAIGIAWILGTVVVFAGLSIGLVRLARETRRCRLIRSGPWRELADKLSPQAVTLLETSNRSLLLTWGFFRPKILLPTGAASWSAERRAIVLAHELAHIRRGDWAMQLAAEALCAIYWFNPLVWIAARRLRHESEYACDDAVLEAGIDATEYATHLLDVARQAIGYRETWASAPAIANPSTLERRISAMLNHQRSRQPLTRRTRICAVAAAVIVAAPIAAIAITEPAAEPVVSAAGADVALVARPIVDAGAPVTPPPIRAPRRARTPAPAVAAQQAPAPGSIAGVMSDASGAVLPGVMLTLRETSTTSVYSRVSDGAGSFAFPDLPPGRYSLIAQLPGFASLSVDLTLEPGQNLQRRLSMRVGALQESLTVTCPAGGAALPASPRGLLAVNWISIAERLFTMPRDVPRAQDQGASKPIRVGGQIRAPRQIRKVNPICPRTILPPPDGYVAILEATIGADGLVHDVRSLRPQTPNEFAESAMEAVRQWQYTPTLLNNVEVPVIMTVTVQYRRG